MVCYGIFWSGQYKQDLHCTSSPGQIETRLSVTQLRRLVLQYFTFPADI